MSRQTARQYKRFLSDSRFKSLYLDLLSFKDHKDFITYGFADRKDVKQGFMSKMFKGDQRNYNLWILEIKSIIDNETKEFPKRLFSELMQIGFGYVSSRGEETELTKILRHKFDNMMK